VNLGGIIRGGRAPPFDKIVELQASSMIGYQPHWQQYKRRRNQFWLVLGAYAPTCFAIALVSMKLFQSLIPVFVAAFLWIGLLTIAGIRIQTWRCPRCGKWFAGPWWYNLGLAARRCAHCGLRKYEN
jgi:hypothetical protein